MKIHSSNYTITVDQNKIDTLIETLRRDERNGAWQKHGHENMSQYIDATCLALVARWNLTGAEKHDVASAISNFLKDKMAAPGTESLPPELRPQIQEAACI